ncbi:MAG: GNAT family N-acetyltransferase [Spirochaetaceae bacterium]|nr:GNAT family N-acetyltransferase [Spirochaetaceae bacterium]
MTAGETERPPDLRATLALRSGIGATLRCLRDDDGELLGAYFASLSPRTRDFYGPHRFDQETADRLCRETRTDTEVVRFVVTVADGDGARIIAYFIVGFRMQDADVKRYAARGTPLDDRTDAYLAPSVEDAYQNTGVGSAVMGHLVPWLHGLGRRRLMLLGGVQQRNERAVAFYRKWGFRTVGEFHTRQANYDMIATLSASPPGG